MTAESDAAFGWDHLAFNSALAEAGLALPEDMKLEVERAALLLRQATDLLLAYLPADKTCVRASSSDG